MTINFYLIPNKNYRFQINSVLEKYSLKKWRKELICDCIKKCIFFTKKHSEDMNIIKSNFENISRNMRIFNFYESFLNFREENQKIPFQVYLAQNKDKEKNSSQETFLNSLVIMLCVEYVFRIPSKGDCLLTC